MDEIGEVADGLQGLELGSLELNLEGSFDGHDQVDVVEGVPLGHLGGGQAGREDQRVVVEEIVKDFGKLARRFPAAALGPVCPF